MTQAKKYVNKTLIFKRFLALPLAIFLVMFVVFPLVLLLGNAFIENGAFSFDAVTTFFTDTDALKILGRSLGIAALTTLICLLLGYPVAYILSLTKIKRGAVMVMLFIMPMWINSLLRVYAIRELLQVFVKDFGLPTLLVGLVSDFLPFAILPIYTVLSNLDKSYLEAAQDLGAHPVRVFFKVVFPLSIAGIISAALMVFMPTVSTFYMNEFLGSNSTRMFGQLIDSYIISPGSGHLGSFYAIIMLLLIGISVLLTNRFTKIGNARGGLW